jgi:hypothetical protein
MTERIETRARSAGDALRTDVAASADTDAAWRELVVALADDTSVVTLDRSTRRPNRRPLAIAAGIVVVAAIIGVAAAVRTHSSTTADDPVSADGAVYLVPDPALGASVLDPQVQPVQVDPTGLGPLGVLVVGHRTGNAFDTIISAAVRTDDPTAGLSGVETVPLADGTARVYEAAGSVVIDQQRGDRWLQVMTSQRHRQAGLDLFASIAVEGDRPTLAAGSGFEVLASGPADLLFLGDRTPEVTLSVVPPDGRAVRVSSLPSTDVLALAQGADTLTAVTVDGHDAWTASWASSTPPAYSVMWQETTTRVVLVTSDVDAADALTVARSLRVVDEATWRATVGLPTVSATIVVSEQHLLRGAFTATFGTTGTWDRCEGDGGETRDGMAVEVRDGSGAVLATTTARSLTVDDLDDPAFRSLASLARSSPPGDGGLCAVVFSVDVPDRADYLVTFGTHGPVAYTRDRLASGDWFITAGDG